ncbi:MAG: hypothetical protein BGO11_17185 [Solirubrobacterales bacterium 70-9]|nr:MAG: hypothetical protein BGO11_17185 [Solirubrobacterales bacterium 70-9]
MNRVLAACAVALISIVALTGTAAAATEVNVRIEGKAETLFEGPLSTVPHGVRATSDKIPVGKLRRCDGINALDPWNVAPEVTPTAASADAMSLVGETFDGQWYRDFEDYFVTRFGPDPQEPGVGAYWGILVNETFTNVGGCQYQLDDGDEVLWVFDAFHERPTLALFPEAAGYTAGPRPLTVEGPGAKGGFAANAPIPVEVVSYADDLENNPPPAPTRAGSSAKEGAVVAPVVLGPKGFEKVETAAPGAQTTNSAGKATVSFATPGWHRIKATIGAPGLESAIRSNRLDVCIEGGGGATLEGATDCDELPIADHVRIPLPTTGEVVGPETEEAKKATSTVTNPSPVATVGSLRLRAPKLDRKQLAKGRVGVSWAVLEAGPGVRKWTISSRTVGAKKARWVTRASGTTQTKATVRLPAGATYKLRFAVTDQLGQTSTLALGKVKVPKARPRRAR